MSSARSSRVIRGGVENDGVCNCLVANRRVVRRSAGMGGHRATVPVGVVGGGPGVPSSPPRRSVALAAARLCSEEGLGGL